MSSKTPMIQDDMLIRRIPIRKDGDIVIFDQICVITKDEFIACYTKWINDAENEYVMNAVRKRYYKKYQDSKETENEIDN